MGVALEMYVARVQVYGVQVLEIRPDRGDELALEIRLPEGRRDTGVPHEMGRGLQHGSRAPQGCGSPDR